MGESFALSAHDASSNALPQPTPTLVAEDDDEPPSSGTPHNRPTQMTEAPNSSFMPTKHDNIHIQEKDFARVDHIAVRHAAPSYNAPELGNEAKFSRDIVNVVDLEKVESNDEGVPRRRHRGFRVVKLAAGTRIRALIASARPTGPQPTYHASFMAMLRYSPLNLLLLFIPVSWALHHAHQSPTLIFIFSGLGIVPLAALLGLGTEQIALRTSQSVGGLLNASLGNLIEMIISGIALKQCELEVVQSTLLGGLLSNLLLVLGMAFVVGGFRFHHQQFHPMVAQLNSSLLIVSVTSLAIPAAFHQYLESRLPAGKELDIILELSRVSAIILILIYVAYLFFQFYSHNHLFKDTIQEYSILTGSSTSSSFGRRSATATLPLPSVAPSTASTTSSSSSEEETPKLNTISALILLVVVTALAYVTAEYLVDSLEGLVAAHPSVSKEWITLIIIPIISNAAEHTTAVIVASKGKFDLAMSVAVGSCIQISLFVIPVLVLVAWGMGKPLTLLFDPLETVVLFLSVLLVKFSVEDGKSHWMSGLVLIAVYVLIAVAFWHFPGDTLRTIQGQVIQCFK
ncbi:hypothetical protein CVT25_005148 [Psilocybe cyanescens]|uniref:Sodium/calcium exchanger membrane region domain-containing protein n=1 Tax=Psilocybe cyanescens TaxID=93625 RepID=A0A409XBL3_PSICY|nr:hypothetical protein CVT25_005148 [Psilocybe cyanescens]